MKQLPVFALGLILGIAAGFALSLAPRGAEAPAAPTESHNHPMLRTDPSLPVPSVEIEASRDAKDGYNIRVITENFAFMPERVGQDPAPNEGHAHLYVNGVKVARLYGPWFNLPSSALRAGDNEVSVTLNANDHSEWMAPDGHVAATVTLAK